FCLTASSSSLNPSSELTPGLEDAGFTTANEPSLATTEADQDLPGSPGKVTAQQHLMAVTDAEGCKHRESESDIEQVLQRVTHAQLGIEDKLAEEQAKHTRQRRGGETAYSTAKQLEESTKANVRLEVSNAGLLEKLITSDKTIRAMERVRGTREDEKEADLAAITCSDDDRGYLRLDSNRLTVQNKPSMEFTTFEFDYVFGTHSSNQEVLAHVEPYVKAALNGHNVCFIVAGKSGSEKFYTLFDGPDAIVPSAAAQILSWRGREVAQG
ncbi:kinesin-like nuclear fusion protein, partial [Lambiella insularis]|nr:kinesin-like nuclear fusion protein [Lambiella insularis]